MKQIMYCQEKIEGIIPKGTVSIARGKVNWWNAEQMGEDCPEFVSMYTVGFDGLKSKEMAFKLKEKLLGKNYVFFNECYYRYTLSKGKLLSFGISFHHIK